MILPIQQQVRARLAELLTRQYAIPPDELPALIIEAPPRRAFGDLALPVAFELARRLGRSPRVIAQEIVNALGRVDGVGRVTAAPNGYVNVFLDRAALLRARLADDGQTPGPSSAVPRVKTIVEHTSINPNKAAHIGHLRNAALGDTLVRLLRFLGVPVEIQNYIDDTGVQVADVVVGFRELEDKTLTDVRDLAEDTRFDYYCWDLYARVTEWYEADKARLTMRAATLHAIEQGEGDAPAMAAFIADRIVRAHLGTMGRLGVDYNLLTWEGDILRLKFWTTAFETLKQNGAVFLQPEGRLAGCWVMRIDEDLDATATAAEADAAGGSVVQNLAENPAEHLADGGELREKVIVRSDGTVTYVGKDIAYQFWKFGLLGIDFHYRPFASRGDGGTVWATATAPADRGVASPAFGRAEVTYNVIDTRQSYLQKLLKQALKAMGHEQQAERSIHFAYEMVALSHRTARELGYQAGDETKPFVEVSGRKGLGVKADDLLDRLIEKAAEEVTRRNPGLASEDTQRIAEVIGVAALRYFMIKFSRTKIIAFDIDDALSFEGESGPYVQYAVVRANNIFNKLRERDGVSEEAIVDALQTIPATALEEGPEADELWDLVLASARLDEVVEQALRTLELSVLAKYVFAVAQMFNAWYHKYQILNEERQEQRVWRAAAASYFRRQMTRALDLMGATVPSRM
ncbi:MAG: arginine--tRNA ligase [Luteitalea sp.]|nr:arginine--tRNA ligase [Luteitalea sp.]